jgi:DNA mismatch repair ATPase MutL
VFEQFFWKGPRDDLRGKRLPSVRGSGAPTSCGVNPNNLVILEQHRAQERVLYERLAEMEILLKEWSSTEFGEICPHGCPIVKRLTLPDLLREFGRL